MFWSQFILETREASGLHQDPSYSALYSYSSIKKSKKIVPLIVTLHIMLTFFNFFLKYAEQIIMTLFWKKKDFQKFE